MASIALRKNKSGSSSWIVSIKYTHSGVQHRETKAFKTELYKKRDVEAWARRRELDLMNGKVYSHKQANVTLAQLTERYICEFEKESGWGRTKASDLRHLMGYSIAGIPVVRLKAKDFIAHIKMRRNTGVAPSPAANDLIWWRIVIQVAIGAWGFPFSLEAIDAANKVLRAHNIIGKSEKRTRRPKLEELEQILEFVSQRDGRQTIPMVDLILFQIFSARRIAETCRLTWQDYNVEDNSVIVREMKDPRKKRGNNVVTILTDQAVAILNLQHQQAGESRIFPYDERSVSANFARTCKILGIKDLRLHDLRHEATSWLFEKGLDIPRVSKVTGHKSWGSLQRYAHLEHVESFNKYEKWKWLCS
ncbi:tyrosine-type recombinase/integrase [Haliea sp. E17]|uniref:tyrosine-type recombinase/integrase n=1 Tax=Haliea sp. E17 TaxID=3401576 RepID=UPI003AAD6D83